MSRVSALYVLGKHNLEKHTLVMRSFRGRQDVCSVCLAAEREQD